MRSLPNIMRQLKRRCQYQKAKRKNKSQQKSSAKGIITLDKYSLNWLKRTGRSFKDLLPRIRLRNNAPGSVYQIIKAIKMEHKNLRIFSKYQLFYEIMIL